METKSTIPGVRILRAVERCDRSALSLALAAMAVSFAIFLSIAISHTRLVEDRGVSDDICYLRQAHLFRSHGVVGGLDTDNEGARYVFKKAQELGLANTLPTALPCHSYSPATGKTIMQYPPGTGAVLALFPPYAQAKNLYLLGSTILFLLICGAIWKARTLGVLAAICATGWLTLYLMVNPGKSSYSTALTYPLCIMLALATVQTFAARTMRARHTFSALAGLLLGIAVTLRLSSALLAAGFLIVFAARAAMRRNNESIVQPVLFGLAALTGIIPELVANFVNTGHPLVTGYGGADTAPPDVSWAGLKTQIRWYFGHSHGLVTNIAIGALAAAMIVVRERRAALAIAGATLVLNLAYFLTHPISSQYYSVPPALFALWTALFAWRSASSTRQTDGGVAPRIRAGVTAVVLAGVGAIWMALGGANATLPPPSDVTFERQAVVWVHGENWLNGPGLQFEYRLKRHAAGGLDLLPREDQNKIINAIAQDRRPQYFVVNNAAMIDVAARESAKFVGRAFGHAVYRLAGEDQAGAESLKLAGDAGESARIGTRLGPAGIAAHRDAD